jgi:hypothetical protein
MGNLAGRPFIVSLVVVQLFQVFSSCVHLLFLSSFLAEVLPDLVPLSRLSSAFQLSPHHLYNVSSLLTFSLGKYRSTRDSSIIQSNTTERALTDSGFQKVR